METLATEVTMEEEDIKRVKFYLHKFFWDNDDLQLVAIFNVVCRGSSNGI
jgi:hypothetical protein